MGNPYIKKKLEEQKKPLRRGESGPQEEKVYAPGEYVPTGEVAGYDYSAPEEIIKYLKEQQAGQDKRLDDLISSGTADYQTNAAQADAGVDYILSGLMGEAGRFQDAKLPKFAGGYESAAAKAKTDITGMQGQYDALRKLQGLTDPEVTAKEQFMMEQSRRSQEGDQRAYRDAVLENLADRGASGSGAEIAAMLGAQQETGQRRMLEDLGTRAGAVDRSMQALDMSGQLSGDIREAGFNESFKRGTAADDAAAFNADLRSAYDQWTTKLKQDQAKDRWGRTVDIASTGASAIQDRFNRGIADTNFAGNVITGSQIPGQQQTTSSVVATLDKQRSERLAKEAADKAAAALKPEQRSFGEFVLDPIGLFQTTK